MYIYIFLIILPTSSKTEKTHNYDALEIEAES